MLHFGSRHAGTPLLDAVQRRVALVRTAEWAPDQLTIVAADVIERGARARHTRARAPTAIEAPTWINERVELVKALAADGRPRAGADCSGCAFIAGCAEFR